MKIFIATGLYLDTTKRFYTNFPDFKNLPFERQRQEINERFSVWGYGWEAAFQKYGFTAYSVPVNSTHLQMQWAKENLKGEVSLQEILFRQILLFQPDILWYDHFDLKLLKKIKEKIPSIKLIVGWSGSAIPPVAVLKEVDLVLSCAPETVSILSKQGLPIEHMHHAFNPAPMKYIQPAVKKHLVTFVGQIVRGEEYHNYREKLLVTISKNYELSIFSPYYTITAIHVVKSIIKKLVSEALHPLSNISLLDSFIRELPLLNKLINLRHAWLPYDIELKRTMHPAVFGYEMYQVINDSDIVLNIHADSSPKYASNMRLFETTGIGSCLLTDYRKNLPGLFNEENEILSYKNENECLEKINWLIENKDERMRIAKTGQKKTMKEHLFEHRIESAVQIFTKHLK
ncbi:MAG: glycosyltransferase [Ignavibacteria bacterium]|nr:glycosyltransferase [Ignavibacteria bacterium]